jgi:hypothetical protein
MALHHKDAVRSGLSTASGFNQNLKPLGDPLKAGAGSSDRGRIMTPHPIVIRMLDSKGMRGT